MDIESLRQNIAAAKSVGMGRVVLSLTLDEAHEIADLRAERDELKAQLARAVESNQSLLADNARLGRENTELRVLKNSFDNEDWMEKP